MGITIDGSDVTSITIDGSSVKEVTIDGTSVWTSYTTVDDFSDGDLSEYSKGYDEDGASFSITTTSYEGTYAVNGTAGVNDQSSQYSTSGLSNYPSAGDKIEYRQREDSTGNNHNAFRFAVQDNPDDGGQGDGDYYGVQFDQEAGEFQLIKYNSGTSTNLASTSQSFSTGIWYRVVIDWGSSGSITVTLYDNNGNQEAQISADDSTFTSGGIGYWVDCQESGSADFKIDEVRIIN